MKTSQILYDHRVTSKVLIWTSGRMGLPFTEVGKIRSGLGLECSGAIQVALLSLM